jgi:hypothetical protein
VTEHRTRVDWAVQIRKLLYEDFPGAKKIVLVMDNLNMHSIASLYEAFEPEEARRIRDRLEIHHTLRHGSWLNMAEIEPGVLNNHGLKDRIPTIGRMGKEVSAWNAIRNEKARTIDWRFTTADARIKLKRLYPQFNS